MDASESLAVNMKTAHAQSVDDLRAQWGHADLLTQPQLDRGKYIAGIAASERCIEEALRLRYEIFNVELGEGLASARETGMDRDEFDDQMTHLVLVEKATGRIVGTYRVQTVRHALAHHGIYSAREYDLTAFAPYFDEAIELGRAGLAQEHRSLTAIILLWHAIGMFMNIFDQKYLFGCSSINSRDPDDGWRTLKTIRANDWLHPDLFLRATAEFSCGDAGREFDPDIGEAMPLPKLFRTYMKLGARVCSEPAVDREFGTVDFLILLDGHNVQLSRLDVLKD